MTIAEYTSSTRPDAGGVVVGVCRGSAIRCQRFLGDTGGQRHPVSDNVGGRGHCSVGPGGRLTKREGTQRNEPDRNLLRSRSIRLKMAVTMGFEPTGSFLLVLDQEARIHAGFERRDIWPRSGLIGLDRVRLWAPCGHELKARSCPQAQDFLTADGEGRARPSLVGSDELDRVEDVACLFDQHRIDRGVGLAQLDYGALAVQVDHSVG